MDTEICYREAQIDLKASNIAAGIIRLSCASEYPVLRKRKTGGLYYEVLSHAPGNVNLGLLNTQGIVLCDHDEKRQIGTVIPGSARVEADRKTRLTIRVTDSVWKKRIADGELPGVSQGYYTKSVVKETKNEADGLPVIHFESVPFEVSLLNASATPADPSVGLFRSKTNMNNLEKILELAMSGSRDGDADFTPEALRENTSITDVIRNAGSMQLTGLNRKFHEANRYIDKNTVGGVAFPIEGLLPMRRDMSAGNFAAGGAFIGTEMQAPTELLFNKVAAIPLGANVISGLKGNFVKPKITAGLTPASLSETALAQASQILFDQDALVPQRVSVTVPISRQLIMQTDGGAEQIIRKMIRDQIGVTVDRLVLFGQGSNDEPLGIVNTLGIGSVLYGGAATFPKVLLHEKSLADGNSDIGSLGWILSTTTRNTWKQTPKIAGSTTPTFIMQDGKVNDFPVVATNQLKTTDQSIFGNWSDVYILLWGNAIDIITDEVSQAKGGEVLIHAILWMNIFIDHPQSFCVSADSAAQ